MGKAKFKELTPDIKNDKESWEGYKQQLIEISLQHPTHFLEYIAKECIPADALKHDCFVMEMDGIVISFCVAIISSTEAELMWMATRKGYQYQGYGSELNERIDNIIFSQPHCEIIHCKSTTPDSVIPGTATDSQGWQKTINRHRTRYSFRYILEDYWDEGNHAAMAVKRRSDTRESEAGKSVHLFGYTDITNILDSVSLKTCENPKSSFGVVNCEIWNSIKKHLQAYYLEIRDRFIFSKPFGSILNQRVKGFVGIAFIPKESSKATFFMMPTEEETRSNEIVADFETPISASVITQIFSNQGLQGQGVFHYSYEDDVISQPSLSQVVDFAHPELKEKKKEGYTTFYDKNTHPSGAFIFFLVTPLIRNIIPRKRIWADFCMGNKTLRHDIQDILEDLRQSRFPGNRYLTSLIDCININGYTDGAKASTGKNIFLPYISLIRKKRHEKIIQLEKEKLNAQGLAIKHYGHTLSHRISPIQRYLDDPKDANLKRARTNLSFITDLSIVLQAYNIPDEKTLFTDPKKERFLDYANEKDELNLMDHLRGNWKDFAETEKITRKPEGGDMSVHPTLHLLPTNLTRAIVPFHLYDPERGQQCRLALPFYSQLFSELLANVTSHGGYRPGDLDREDKSVLVGVGAFAHTIHKHGEAYDVLALKNMWGSKPPPPSLDSEVWERWPMKEGLSGPRLAISIFRKLNIGDLWMLNNRNEKTFTVGIWFKDMTLS